MLVKFPWEYQWSSAAFHAGLQKSDPLVMDKTLRGLVKDWREFLLQGVSKEEEIRLAMKTGLPACSEEFTPMIEKLTGRDLSRGKRGRPRKGGG
jgi:hypothetical protein